VSSSPWSNTAIILTALGAVVFVASYAWTTRGAWRDSTVGLNVMTFMAVIAVVSSLAVAAIFFGTNWPGREVVRGVAWSLVGACIWWRVFILYRVQHRG
jgi:hypothetical protein